MDGFYKKKLAGILKKLTGEGRTILMVSHDIEFCAEFGDTCAMFFYGSVVTSKPAAGIFPGEQLLYHGRQPDGAEMVSGCSDCEGCD